MSREVHKIMVREGTPTVEPGILKLYEDNIVRAEFIYDNDDDDDGGRNGERPCLEIVTTEYNGKPERIHFYNEWKRLSVFENDDCLRSYFISMQQFVLLVDILNNHRLMCYTTNL